MSDKIGIFGGVFDPIHNGHLILAQMILEKIQLNEMWFIPANYHIFKKENEVSQGIHRSKMVELAILGNDRFKCLNVEITRNKITYTYDTLIDLKQSFPKKRFYFLIGADNLNTFDKWKNTDEIFSLCKLVVFGRPDTAINETGKIYLKKAEWIKTSLVEIASTEIRKRINEGKSCRYWIPDAVNDYIIKNKLYL